MAQVCTDGDCVGAVVEGFDFVNSRRDGGVAFGRTVC